MVGTDGQLQKFRSELDIRQDFPDEKNVRQEVTLHSFTVDEDIPILRSERNDFSLFNNTPSIQNLCNRKIQRIDMTFKYRILHYNE